MLFPASRRIALSPKWTRDILWRRARAVPSLDLRFADNKRLVDATTGQNLVTFTRASSGTYVDSQGVIRTATTNLLLQSEDLGTTWTRLDGLQLSTNQIVAPNGSTTADLLTGNGSQIGYLEQPTASSNQFTNGITYTFSIYLKKANTSTVLTLLLGATFNSGGSNPVATWNLDTGIPSFSNGATGSMTPVGNGWYRCVLTDTATATETRNQQWLRMSSTSGDVYAWGAQLEQSSTVGEYIPTTSTINSAPRFDHNPTTGESLGLLVEEQRTNLLLRSEELNEATSWAVSNASIASNAVVAPNGLQTADKLVEDTAASTGHFVRPTPSPALSAGQSYVYSVFAKAAERTFLQLILTGVGAGGANIIAGFDLNAGTAGTPIGGTSSISPYGNGWYRCSLSVTASTTASTLAQIRLSLNSSATPSSYTGDGTSGIYIWGAQLEAGAFPTSYIPTTTAAVTRSADVASISGTNFSSWYRQDEGTVFAEGAVAQPASGGNQFFFRSSDSSYNNSIVLNVQQSGFTSISTAAGGVFDGIASSSATLSANTTAKFAGAYAANNLGLSLNGATAVTDATATMPLSLGRADIGSDHAGLNRVKAGTIRRLTYWPQRLANSTLQQITQ